MSKQEDQTTAVDTKETQGPAGPVILFFIIGFAVSGGEEEEDLDDIFDF